MDDEKHSLIEEVEVKEYLIKEPHTELNFDDLPFVSCFELSNILSGKWVTKMFDSQKLDGFNYQSKTKFLIFTYDEPKIFFQKLNESFSKKTQSSKYLEIEKGKYQCEIHISLSDFFEMKIYVEKLSDSKFIVVFELISNTVS